MKARFMTIAAATALVAFAAPAGAAANPTPSDVQGHVRSAEQAKWQAARAARAGHQAQAGHALRVARREASRARFAAAGLDGVVVRTRALIGVAALYDRMFDLYAEIVDQVPALGQDEILGAIHFSSLNRDQIVAVLTRVAEKLPEPVRTKVLEVVAAFQQDGDLESLVDALSSDDVVAAVKAKIAGELDAITSRIDGLLTELEGLVGVLPGPASGIVSQVIGTIRTQLTGVFGMLNGRLGSILDGLPGGSNGGLNGMLCGSLGGVFNGIFGILGGGVLGGSVPLPCQSP
jgi:hypothetical protein